MKQVSINVGVLAIQGDFTEHVKHLNQAAQSLNATSDDTALAVDVREIRNVKQVNEELDGLIIPGGESTVMHKHLSESGFLQSLKAWIRKKNKFTWGTCAGLILLSNRVEGRSPTLGGLDITCSRNSFGRQIDSFECTLNLSDPKLAVNGNSNRFHGIFIRAPQIKSVDTDEVSVLCRIPKEQHRSDISDAVGVRQNNVMACTFHPELTSDTTWHKYFLTQVVFHKTNESL